MNIMLYKDKQREPIPKQFGTSSWSIHFQLLKDLIKAIQSEEPGWTCIWSLSKLSTAFNSNVLQIMQPVMKQHCCVLGFINAPWDWRNCLDIHGSLFDTFQKFYASTHRVRGTSYWLRYQTSELLFHRHINHRVCSLEFEGVGEAGQTDAEFRSSRYKLNRFTQVLSQVRKEAGKRRSFDAVTVRFDSFQCWNVDQVCDLGTLKVDKMQCKMVKSGA